MSLLLLLILAQTVLGAHNRDHAPANSNSNSQPPSNMAPACPCGAAKRPTITVFGEGRAPAIADLASAAFLVDIPGLDSAGAWSAARAEHAAIVEALGDVNMTSWSVDSLSQSPVEGPAGGFLTSFGYSVHFFPAEACSTIAQLFELSPTTRLQSTVFYSSAGEASRAGAVAVAEAAVDARASAQAVADATGLALGPLLSLTVEPMGYEYFPPKMALLGAAKSPSTTVSARVKARYALQ